MSNQISLTGNEFNQSNAIVVGEVAYDIGVRVHKWDEPTGFNGYQKPKRYGKRKNEKGFIEEEQIDLIEQFLIHHSGADRETPAVMAEVLRRKRLSVHFALEDNGQIWQFLNAIVKAKHAGQMNDTSIGVECCHYPSAWENPNYYSEARRKRTGNLPHEIIEQPVYKKIRKVFAFTNEAVDSLARLAAGCWIALGHQRTNGFISEDEYNYSPWFPNYEANDDIPWGKIKKPKKHIGLIAHRHCTTNKWDPAGLNFDRLEEISTDYYWDFRHEIELTK
jgi:hypothetical protein